jgi:hypothetical protein
MVLMFIYCGRVQDVTAYTYSRLKAIRATDTALCSHSVRCISLNINPQLTEKYWKQNLDHNEICILCHIQISVGTMDGLREKLWNSI